MKPTIKALQKRIEEAADLIPFTSYALLTRTQNEVSIVDLRNTCEVSKYSSTEIAIFCKGFGGNYYFETIVMTEKTAKQYSAKSGRYLAITFTL